VIVSLLFLVVANGAALLGAWAMLQRVKTGQSSVDLVLFLVIRLLIISASILLAGVSGTLTRGCMAFVSMVALGVLVLRGAHRQINKPKWLIGGGWLAVLWSILLLRLAIQVWFFSPYEGDAVAYHLPKVAEWVRSGGITREMGLHPSATFPAGFELIEVWWVLFLRHDILIEVAGVEFLALAAASTAAIARQLGFEPKVAWFAALIYVLTPGVYFGATSCMNDTPAAALILATMALFLGGAGFGPVLTVLGLGLGTKATYGFAIPGMALLAMLARPNSSQALRSKAWTWGLGVFGILVGGFWYVRNWVWFGNPVYPIGAPDYALSSVSVHVGPSFPAFISNLTELVDDRIYDSHAPLGANLDRSAGWGAVNFGCGILAMMIGIAADPRLRVLALAFGVSLVSCLALVDHHPWYVKYVLFFPAILAISAAWFSTLHPGLAAVTFVALAFAALSTFLPYDLPLARFSDLARQSWSERSSLSVPEGIRRGETVAACGGYRARSYLLYGPDFSRRVVYLRPESTQDFLNQLRQSGARAVYFEPSSTVQQELLSSLLAQKKLEPLRNSFYRVPETVESATR
jgi:hypothetical protein